MNMKVTATSENHKTGIRILIVNDDPVQLQMLAKLLTRHGFEVISCKQGKEALEKLGELGLVDLIIADLYMPEIDGWKLCRLLRSEEFSSYNNIPILIMSATFSGSDAEDIARELGVNGFIPIPYNQEELLSRIDHIMLGNEKPQSLRVLVVEDDHDLREIITEGLVNYDYTVFSAADGKEAYTRFYEVKPDIIILDFHLPDNDGQQLLPVFKSPESQSSVILITGNPSPELAVNVIQMGADAYIRKPFTIQYLINLCEKIRREWSLLRAEKLLEERTLELNRILDTSVDGIMITDPDGFITQLNKFLGTITGYAPEELIGKHTSALLPQGKEHQEKAKLFSRRLHEENILVGFELNWLRKDAMPIDLEVNAAQLKDNQENITGVVASIRDISERKKADAELKRAKELAEAASRAKSEFLGNMSHELRTPLNHIIGFTELVVSKHYGELNPVQEEYLQDVLRSSNHLLSLIINILDLSRMESGKLKLTLSEVNPKSVMEKTVSTFQEQALRQGLQLSMHSNNIPETVRADELKLSQILTNLISNAIKFTPAGGKISLSTQMADYLIRPGLRWKDPEDMQIIDARFYGDKTPNQKLTRCIQFTIADNGIGINPEDQKRIFEPFEQVDGSSSKKYQGTGLGLTLTKNLVELHGGKLWVDSRGNGKGSTFRFIIPVYE